MALPLVIGRGSKVTVGMLPPGSTAEIIPQTITLSADVAAAATTVSVNALTQPITASLAQPVYLTFTDGLDGTDKPVVVTASAAVGATSLTVLPVHSAIVHTNGATTNPTTSNAYYPVLLQARTGADITTSNNNVTTSTFETIGYEDGIISRIGYSLDAAGNYVPTDSGYKTVQFAFLNFVNVWLSLFLPVPGGYTTGQIYKGIASVTKCDPKVPADGIITVDTAFSYRGKILLIDPS